jgi:putative spermidine/putrescine transport system ATP-binding protein/spermidine/putrescine transport system ATP-binding protein
MAFDLELARVGKVYPNGTLAVADLDLQVEKGEFISFLGPSGCGKTTTLRMIAGFEEITSGDILVRGKRINDLPAEKRPTSTIFQNFALFPHMTVRDNIEYGLHVKGLAARDRQRKAAEIMEKLHLGALAERRPGELSGGQRQRTALARGLVVEPDILLLDEPLGALDANLRKPIQNELKLLQRNVGITFIFVTHAQSEALVLSDRIVVMNRGRVEQLSRPYELYTRPKTEFVARFIGRNSILAGTLSDVSDGLAVVGTPFGPLSGSPNDPGLAVGVPAAVVVPSEAMEVRPFAGGERLPNTLKGRLIGRTMTGLEVHLTVALENDQEITIEASRNKYERDFASPDVLVSWPAREATVIRAS